MRKLALSLSIVALLFAEDALARGGRGDGTLFFLLVLTIGIGYGIYRVHKRYPDFFRALGGFALLFIFSGWIAQLADFFGIAKGRELLVVWAIAFAGLFGLAWHTAGQQQRAWKRRLEEEEERRKADGADGVGPK